MFKYDCKYNISLSKGWKGKHHTGYSCPTAPSAVTQLSPTHILIITLLIIHLPLSSQDNISFTKNVTSWKIPSRKYLQLFSKHNFPSSPNTNEQQEKLEEEKGYIYIDICTHMLKEDKPIVPF